MGLTLPAVATGFDAVHDPQQAFRRLLQSFSFPGRPVDLSGPASHLLPLFPHPKLAGLALVATVLTDAETPYAVVGEGPFAEFLLEWSSHPATSVTQAQLVFVTQWDDRGLAAVLDTAVRGTLPDPHRAATVFVHTSELAGPAFRWSGPGVDGTLVHSLPEGSLWTTARGRCVAEFPLGIDMAFLDDSNRVLALPRTTRLVQVEA